MGDLRGLPGAFFGAFVFLGLLGLLRGLLAPPVIGCAVGCVAFMSIPFEQAQVMRGRYSHYITFIFRRSTNAQ